VIIAPALPLALRLAANELLGMMGGRLKDLLTIRIAAITHQAAPDQNAIQSFCSEPPRDSVAALRITADRNSCRVSYRVPADGAAANQTGRSVVLLHRLRPINSAELIKHASNSFLAMKISFINMIADPCEAVGADAGKVAEAVGMDSRIGGSFLKPGVGFVGSCFPKDLQAFVRVGPRAGCDFMVLREVERINQHRIDLFVSKIKDELWVVRGKQIGVWGSPSSRAPTMFDPPRR